MICKQMALLTLCDVTDLVLVHNRAGRSEARPARTHVASVLSRSVRRLQVYALLSTVVSPRCTLINICWVHVFLIKYHITFLITQNDRTSEEY